MAAQETAVPSVTMRGKKFFREVKAELKKVTWPTKKELGSYTIVVFVAVLFVSILIWIIDNAFAEGLKLFLK